MDKRRRNLLSGRQQNADDDQVEIDSLSSDQSPTLKRRTQQPLAAAGVSADENISDVGQNDEVDDDDDEEDDENIDNVADDAASEVTGEQDGIDDEDAEQPEEETAVDEDDEEEDEDDDEDGAVDETSSASYYSNDKDEHASQSGDTAASHSSSSASETASSTASSTAASDDESDDDDDDSQAASGADDDDDDDDDESASDDQQEEYDDYNVKRCYYPVQMEDFYSKRYSIIRKIGWGHFSTVWLSYDVQTKHFVALKVVRAGKTYFETAEDEIKLGKAVDEGLTTAVARGADPVEAAALRNNVIRVLDHFYLDGQASKHVCITFDLLGQNLLDLIKRAQSLRKEAGTERYGALPLANVRSITEKILRGLKHLHENCNIIHTDLKPENVLVSVSERAIKEMVRYVSSIEKQRRPSYMMSTHEYRQYHKQPSSLTTHDAEQSSSSSSGIVDDQIHRHFVLNPDPCAAVLDNINVKIADLGNACWTHNKFTDEIQTKEYRALESIVVVDYGTAADIWSVACVAYECATGDYLFPCHRHHDRSSDEDHLLLIIERCARVIPKRLVIKGREFKKMFKTNGRLHCCPDVSRLLHSGKTIREVLASKYLWTSEQSQQFAQFLLPMLEYDPVRRATASTMLAHAWMTSQHIHAENHVLDDPVTTTTTTIINQSSTAVFSTTDAAAARLSPSGMQTPTSLSNNNVMLSSTSDAGGGRSGSESAGTFLLNSSPQSSSGVSASQFNIDTTITPIQSTTAAGLWNAAADSGSATVVGSSSSSNKYGRVDVAGNRLLSATAVSNNNSQSQGSSSGSGGAAREGGDVLSAAAAASMANSVSGKHVVAVPASGVYDSNSSSIKLDEPVRKLDVLRQQQAARSQA